MTLDAKRLQARLSELVAGEKIPGAALGVFHDGETIELAAGVASLNTGIEVTPDTAFQIGSQGKFWTATVLMQFVDEGLVDLDAPVRTYLPEFRVADPEVTEAVTVRHLLTHTSGIDGEHFLDTGRGDDCLEKYVASCASLEQIHPLGSTMSYCNTGLSIVGRLLEVLTGKVWDDVMRERLFEPLGLEHAALLPEDSIMHRVAVGHASYEPGGPLKVTPQWNLFRNCGPMGGETATVGDVLRFARLHLANGRTPDGTRLLSEDSANAMHAPHMAIPDPTLADHVGVGSFVYDWGGRRLFGHDGGTIGQRSRLRILPDSNLAVTLLTNGGNDEPVYRELFSEILAEVAGIGVPPAPVAPETPPDIDLSRYAGTYRRLAVRYELEAADGRLEGRIIVSGPLAEMLPDPESGVTMTPIDESMFLAVDDRPGTIPGPAVFYEFDDGVPRYLHDGGRANRRV